MEAPEIENKKQMCASFHTVKTFLKDNLLGAKLVFFITISSDLKPFLTEFQTNSPLVPFLHGSINNIVVSCAQRFVEPNKVKELKIRLKGLLRTSYILLYDFSQ